MKYCGYYFDITMALCKIIKTTPFIYTFLKAWSGDYRFIFDVMDKIIRSLETDSWKFVLPWWWLNWENWINSFYIILSALLQRDVLNIIHSQRVPPLLVKGESKLTTKYIQSLQWPNGPKYVSSYHIISFLSGTLSSFLQHYRYLLIYV